MFDSYQCSADVSYQAFVVNRVWSHLSPSPSSFTLLPLYVLCSNHCESLPWIFMLLYTPIGICIYFSHDKEKPSSRLFCFVFNYLLPLWISLSQKSFPWGKISISHPHFSLGSLSCDHRGLSWPNTFELGLNTC